MKVSVSELQVGDIIDGERRVVKVEKYLGTKMRVTFDYVAGSRKGERAAYVEKGDKLVSVEREVRESATARMKHLLAESKDSTYLSMMKDTDAAFLEQVAAILKKRLGKKFEELRVHKGVATVFLAFKGQDKGDIDIDGYVALSTQSWTDVDVVLDAKHAMRGRIDRRIPFKTGVLTPQAVADIVAAEFG